MAKAESAVDQAKIEDETREEAAGADSKLLPTSQSLAVAVLIIFLLLLFGFQAAYAGRVFPGISVNGVYLSGLNRQQATAALQAQTDAYMTKSIPINYGPTTLRIPVSDLGTKFDNQQAVDLAMSYGRAQAFGSLRQQLRSLLGRPTNLSAEQFSSDRLVPYVRQIDDDINRPVVNSTLGFDGDRVVVTPAKAGQRLDTGMLTAAVEDRLAATSDQAVDAPVYLLAPTIATEELEASKQQAEQYLAGSLKLQLRGQTMTVDREQIVKWIDVARGSTSSFDQSWDITAIYADYQPPLQLKINSAKVENYVADLAGRVDQNGQNATLAMQNGQLSVTAPSRDGYKLDRTKAVADITETLNTPDASRNLSLAVNTTKPEVNEDNYGSLGIKELISEGETFFPGSPSTRLINVRAGASKFNGVLLKPGEVFSFGKLLGDVGPQTGYVPELVILGDHEEKQYGGGLCQVSSTAFRAALAAGLPILERVNHAFAISYYTAPYGVPGVDATIYYPQVDFKFRNDTGNYLLMQTVMQGTTLKFDFYGTKTKTGDIRGPQFISGSTDATQPSHTVFYRDVKDLAGNVIKTDTFNTYYKSSKDFPITKQFN